MGDQADYLVDCVYLVPMHGGFNGLELIVLPASACALLGQMFLPDKRTTLIASMRRTEVLYFCYFCPQIKDKSFLIFFLICEVFNLLLANEIRLASTVTLID